MESDLFAVHDSEMTTGPRRNRMIERAFPIALKFPPLVLLRRFVSHAFLVGLLIPLAIRDFSLRQAGAEG